MPCPRIPMKKLRLPRNKMASRCRFVIKPTFMNLINENKDYKIAAIPVSITTVMNVTPP